MQFYAGVRLSILPVLSQPCMCGKGAASCLFLYLRVECGNEKTIFCIYWTLNSDNIRSKKIKRHTKLSMCTQTVRQVNVKHWSPKSQKQVSVPGELPPGTQLSSLLNTAQLLWDGFGGALPAMSCSCFSAAFLFWRRKVGPLGIKVGTLASVCNVAGGALEGVSERKPYVRKSMEQKPKRALRRKIVNRRRHWGAGGFRTGLGCPRPEV